MKKDNPQPFVLERQVPEPLDDATLAALELGEEAICEGRVVTPEQAKINARARYKAWQESQRAEAVPAFSR